MPKAPRSRRSGSRRWRLWASTAVAIGACWALAAQASAYVYWADNGSVARANLDGTGAEPGFIQGGQYAPSGVAVDGAHVYWSSFGSIGRANLDGGAVDKSFITGLRAATGVAVDSQHVYWTNADAGGIGRANLDGSGVDQNFIMPPGSPPSSPRSVAVAGQHIYWTDSANGRIGRANLDGSGADWNFITGADSAVGLAVDGQRLYWTRAGGGAIGRADLDGSHFNQSFITGATIPTGVAVDGSHIYWTNRGDNTIGRANLDGSGVDQAFITATSAPMGIAVGPGPSGTASAVANGHFRSQPVGTVGEPHPVTVTNVGHGDDLHFGQVGVTGDSEDYSIIGDSCTGAAVAIGASCTVDVSFMPQGPGATTAELSIPSDDPQSPLTIELTGTGTPETTITSGPSGTTHDPTPSFGFAASPPDGETFQCKVDSRAFAPCTSPVALPLLPDGAHTFAVRATVAGVTDPTPATRSFTVKTAAVGVSGNTLTVTAASGVADEMSLTRPSAATLKVTTLSGIHPGPKCVRRGDTEAICSGTGVTTIKVLAGDGSDRIVNSTNLRGVLLGGEGNDFLLGGWGRDSISGGPGVDTMKGAGGDDTLLARDLASDRMIDCGAGSHDSAPIDLLPRDPAAVVKGCEAAPRR